MRSPRIRGAACLALAIALGGCATGGDTTRIDTADIPTEVREANLRKLPPDDYGGNRPAANPAKPRVYWVVASDEGSSLTPLNVDVGPSDSPTIDQLKTLLSKLAAGTSASGNETGFVSYLPPDARLTVDKIEGGTAHLNLTLPNAVATKNQPYLIGQIVLSATTITPERGNPIRSVLIRVNGQAPDVPLPNGKRTMEPVTRLQYQNLITASDQQNNEKDKADDVESDAPNVP